MRACVVLAGGRGSRMGENKALFKLNGKEMLLWITEGLKPIADLLVVVAKDEHAKLGYQKILPPDVKVICDIAPLEGPLVGMYSAFREINSRYAYVHPVDSPVVSKRLIEYLFFKVQGYDACMVKWDDGLIQPLHAVYRIDGVLPVAREALEKGDTSAKVLASKVKVNYVSPEELRQFDERLMSFTNINTPSDVATIKDSLVDM